MEKKLNVKFFTCSLLLKDVNPAMKLTKDFSSATWVIYRNFSLYFKDIYVSKCEWVRNPFSPNIYGVITCEQEQFIDISCDGSFKDMCDTDKHSEFQLAVIKFIRQSIRGFTSFCGNTLVQNCIFCCCCHENKILIMVDNRKGTVSCHFITDTTIW